MVPYLRLADHDGTLCIVCAITDYNAPFIHCHYWPTTTKTRDFLRFYFDDAELSRLDAISPRRSMPGEYWIDPPFRWHAGTRVSLVNGAQTQPVKTDVLEAKKPKRAKNAEWSGGKWRVPRASGVVTVDPLSV